MDTKIIEQIIGYTYKDKKLCQLAFTHPSYANEHKTASNQRLEFLGDAVLELIVTDKLYQTYSGDEGKLTKYRAALVSEASLAFITEQLGLDKHLLLGKGEAKNATESSGVKCDLFEAVVGSIYLDGGYKPAQEFVLSVLGEAIKTIASSTDNNYKSALQEKLVGAKIVYRTTKHGEAHNPHYVCVVYVNDVICGKGEGGNKKQAEQQAAKEAFETSFRA